MSNYQVISICVFIYRSSDGRVLVISSTDGYCSVVTFNEGEVGLVYTPLADPQTATSSSDTVESNKVLYLTL